MTTDKESQLVEAMCEAPADSGARLSAIMREMADPSPRAVGVWSIGDTAQHVAEGPEFLLAVAHREGDLVTLEGIPADNARHLAEDPQRDPRLLADRFDAGIAALVAYARRMAADPVVYLLLIWNRIGRLRPMLHGQLAVWGRRPWAVNRLQPLLKM